jgi:superfamily I DNA/RNA helicase
MMRLRSPESWSPHGVDSLEPNAWRALKSRENTLVVAGPGSGKTEFLAQRAAFLLETGICAIPHRVLAISFKTDAAENLAARVKKRCDPVLAQRFVSLTFDAFTKSLADRFFAAIPAHWRPTWPYQIVTPARRDVDVFLDRMLQTTDSEQWRAQIAALGGDLFHAKDVGSVRLSAGEPSPKSGRTFAVLHWWNEHLRCSASASRISFVMINRLAELILRTNPEVARAMLASYRFVFLDEFQDTTYAQYDFLCSVFSGSAVTLTAVGDNKQRIMVWAGAIPDIFGRFIKDFEAIEIPLTFNFRSSPGLVQIQKIVAAAIDPNAPEVISRASSAVDGEVAQIWTFGTVAAEAAKVVDWIKRDMLARGTTPRDYGLLVRQTAERFEGSLVQAFAPHDLRVRNESKQLGRTTVQDLLSERLSILHVALLRLAIHRRHPEAWYITAETLEALRGVDPDDAVHVNQVNAELQNYVKTLRKGLNEAEPSYVAEYAANSLISFIAAQAWKQTFPEYATGDKLEIVTEAFRLHLAACVLKCSSLKAALDEYEGTHHTPLMTVHKSKGLEYDTMIFMGLDDESWWSHTPRNPDGLATFFVALSRAKQRALFTFCSQRGDRRKVADLYRLLQAARVTEVDF